MADKAYEIKITTPYDAAGAKQAQADLAGIAQQAEKVGASAGTATAGIEGAEQATGRFVESAGKLREANGRFVKVGEDAEEAAGHIGNASHEADHFIATLKAGVGIDLGHRLIEGLAEIPAKFREAIAEGVRFNQEMESLGLNLAGAFRAAAPEKYLNFAAAQAEGSRALDLLREKANALGLDMHALGESLSINLAALTHSGVTDLEQQINLITLLQQVTAAKGISGFQATRDIIDLLNGQANRTILGKELEPLGVNNESIKQAKEQGQLYEFLTSKFGAYTEAAGAYADTFAAAQQRLKNETEQLYGEISKPVFDVFKEEYQTLAQEIAKPEVREGLRAIGYDVATIVSAGAGLLNWAVENAGALTTLGEAVGVAALAWAAFKAAAVVGNIGGRTAEWLAETLAIGENTAALEANAAARATVSEAGAAGAVGGAEGGVIGAAEAEASGVAIGTAVAGVLQGAAALAIGFAIGNAIRAHIDSVDQAKLGAAGEASISRGQKLATLQGEISSASTDEQKAKLRKQLQDYINQGQNELSTKESAPGDEIGEGGLMERSEAQQTAIDSLTTYLGLARHLNEEFDKLAGKNPLADPKVKRDKAAIDAHEKKPEYLLQQAELSDNPEEVRKQKHAIAVAKKEKELTEKEGLPEDYAAREAEDSVTGSERLKDDAEAQREGHKSAREGGTEAVRLAAEAQRRVRETEAAQSNEKRRADTLVSEREEIAITSARARGDEATANALEKQRDIHREIVRLMQAGVGYTEAQGLAQEKVELANKLADQKAEDRGSSHTHRPEHEPRSRRGERGAVTISGYRARPGDAGTGSDGFVDANAPRFAFDSAAANRSADRFASAQAASFAAGNLFGGPSTAAAGLAPVLGTVAAASPDRPPAAPAGNNGPELATAAQGAATAGATAAEQARQAAESLGGLKDSFNGIAQALQELRTQVQTALSQIAHQT